MDKFCLVVALFFLCSCFDKKKSVDEKYRCDEAMITRKCPQVSSTLFLPRTYPAQAIYLGFSDDEVHKSFLDELILSVKNLKNRPKVNLLIPRVEDDKAYKYLQKYYENAFSFLNFIPTSSESTVWAQDFFEILINPKTGITQIVDLPYAGREGENIPTSVALFCKKELIEQREFNEENMPSNGDYGGNVEALSTGVVIIGNNLTEETYKILRQKTSQEIIDINVHWLETGHVDELITTLPHHENASDCEQSLLVASPKLALELVNHQDNKQDSFASDFIPYYDDFDTWPDRSFCLLKKNSTKEECKELFKANLIYQASIEKSISTIQEAFQKKHQCQLKVISFPQLFVPLKKMSEYLSLEDRAVALNPNSVNNIFFFPHLFLAKQEFLPFQQAVKNALDEFPYDVHYANSKFVHELNGGIHCATNISYGCHP